MPTQIHATAIVSSKASIGNGCVIGPYCIVGDRVRLGDNCRLLSHVVVEGITTIGSDTEIFPFASVGHRPQDLKYKGEESTLEIGDRNIIREYVTLQPGTVGGGMKTTIGNGNLFMANSHVGHDSRVGSHNIIANSVAIAGHVTIADHIIAGGMSAIHQFVRIGNHAMLAGGAIVVQDIPPCCIAQGDRASLVGINKIGLQRRGVTGEEIRAVHRTFRDLLRAGKNNQQNRSAILEQNSSFQLVRELVEFCGSSERGVAHARRVKQDDTDD